MQHVHYTTNGDKLCNVDMEYFDSMNEYVHTIQARDVHDGWYYLESQEDTDGTFQNMDYDCAIDYALNGDTENTYALLDERNNAKIADAMVQDVRPRTSFDYVGGSPCVTRAIRGLPRAMYNVKRVPHAQKAVHLIYVLGTTHKMSHAEILRYGVKVLSVIDVLNTRGYSIRLDVCKCTAVTTGYNSSPLKKGHKITCSVCVKDYKDTLNYARVAFALCNSAYTRRLYFRYLETYTHYDRVNGQLTSYGCSIPRVHEDTIAAIKHNNKNAVVITLDDVKGGFNSLVDSVNAQIKG